MPKSSEPSLVRKFARNLRTQGVMQTGMITRRYLAQRSCQLYYKRIRGRLPVAGYASYGGIEVPSEVAPKRRYGERSVLSRWSPDRPVYKGYLDYLRKYVQSGDRVTIIGGGRGISSVVTARRTGLEGSVTVFEGSPEMFLLIDTVTTLNGVRDQCTLRPAVVGPAIDVYTDDSDLSHVSPSELESCDLLLLDCEGAEYAILSAIDIRPRYIGLW